MTEQDLINLNFKKTIVSPEESGDENGFYYYSMDFGRGICLISLDNGSVENDEWHIEFLEEESIKLTDAEELSTLINIMKNNTVCS